MAYNGFDISAKSLPDHRRHERSGQSDCSGLRQRRREGRRRVQQRGKVEAMRKELGQGARRPAVGRNRRSQRRRRRGPYDQEIRPARRGGQRRRRHSAKTVAGCGRRGIRADRADESHRLVHRRPQRGPRDERSATRFARPARLASFSSRRSTALFPSAKFWPTHPANPACWGWCGAWPTNGRRSASASTQSPQDFFRPI